MLDSPTTARHCLTKCNIAPDHKRGLLFSSFGTRRSMVFAYGFTFAFVTCTIFLFLNYPSNSSSSIWFTNILKKRSQFSTIFSHFIPNNSFQPFRSPSLGRSQNSSFQFSRKRDGFSEKINGSSRSTNDSSSSTYETKSSETKEMKSNDNVKEDLSSESVKNASMKGVKEKNVTVNSSSQSVQNASVKGAGDRNVMVNSSPQNEKNDSTKGFEEKNIIPNHTSLSERESDRANGSSMVSQRDDNWLETMSHCNIFDGGWVKDDSYPLYEPGSCPHIDEPFNCFLNGRRDNGYERFRWQPNGCNIPRLDGKKMLELLRGKRLVYVGDSLNRNMWESMVCILRNSVEDKSKVFEASGREEFRTEGSYSFVFTDYNFSVEFFRSPFLVQEWEMPDRNGSKKETLRLDVIERSSDKYKTADVLVFNTGHWWTHEKTSRGKGYYQEGSHIYGELNVAEAFRKAMTTWTRWIDANVNPMKTQVFFRGYSVSHFSGGQWNSGGQCDSETEPIKDDKYLASSLYPPNVWVMESVMKGLKTPVYYLNITRMTDYRKDAHPSTYRKQNLTEEERLSPLRFQDCSHWCLPGVPDTWNEILYAQFLLKHNQKQHQNQEQQQTKS
ncbi:hypothetical protein F0562_035608 [Nyssa sinensis]|uniref:Uncharacterized protein n=1 Tax=Nyssa sinensis TaxID=561372 RepID=A0A5J5AG08_9ASTE|nr:hypothetical protein F0562_035608 [Nyssa sinensis]